MSSLPFPGHGAQFLCPVCHDAGYLPSSNPARPLDWILCPCCHQDVRWGLADDAGDDGADADGPLVDLALAARRPNRN